MEEEKNMIKGQEGEAFVIREVGKVANYLGKTIRCFNHVILDFDSVYGSRTAELDHIIICGDKILIGETKNANYVSTEYSEIPWNLMNGIIQLSRIIITSRYFVRSLIFRERM